MGRPIITCEGCGQQKEKHAKNRCKKCYKKTYKAPTITCKECGRQREHGAFGLCRTCHIRLHHYDKVKEYNARKYHKIPLELYQKLMATECLICGFRKTLDLHHIDGNHDNTAATNLVALCPNHHRLLHHPKYKEETRRELLKEVETRNDSPWFREKFGNH